MRQVAREAGCTIGLINHWFTSKEDLVLAAWQEAVRHENARADLLRTEGKSVLGEVLSGALPTTADLRRKEFVWQAFAALAISNPVVRKIYNHHYAYARRILSEALASGRTPDERDVETADILIAATDGIAKMAALDPGHWTPARQRDALRRLIEPHLGASPTVVTAKRKRKAGSG